MLVVVGGDGEGLVLVGDGDGLVVVGDGLGDGGGRLEQVGLVIVSVSRVTAATLASARPKMVTLLLTEIDCWARMVPWKVVPVLRVAELPTCQNTLQAWALPMKLIVVPVSVVRVEPAWKMKTALGSPCPFRISWPLTSSEDVALYTPGVRTWPALRGAVMEAVLAREAASV